jgi:hypothetical protein
VHPGWRLAGEPGRRLDRHGLRASARFRLRGRDEAGLGAQHVMESTGLTPCSGHRQSEPMCWDSASTARRRAPARSRSRARSSLSRRSARAERADARARRTRPRGRRTRVGSIGKRSTSTRHESEPTPRYSGVSSRRTTLDEDPDGHVTGACGPPRARREAHRRSRGGRMVDGPGSSTGSIGSALVE